MSSALGVGVGKGMGSGESRLRKLIQGKAESRLAHQARAPAKRDSRYQLSVYGVSRSMEAVAVEGKALETVRKSKNFAKRFTTSRAMRLATQANGGARMSARCYSTESGVPKNGDEASKPKENPFGSVPRSASEQTVSAFRDNMKKEAARLSMEPEEVIKVEGVGKSGAKLSTNKTGAQGSQSSTSGSSHTENAGNGVEPTPYGRGKRATILVLILAGVAAGLYSVGAIGGWIDDYKDGKDYTEEKEDGRFLVPRERPGVSGKKNPSSSSHSSHSSSSTGEESVDWTNLSNFPKNVVISLSALDDKVLDAAMASDLVQSIREKLGYDPLNKDGSLKNQSPSSTGLKASTLIPSSSSDKIDLGRAAVVSEAIKDVSNYSEVNDAASTTASTIIAAAPVEEVLPVVDEITVVDLSPSTTTPAAVVVESLTPVIVESDSISTPVAAIVESIVIPVIDDSSSSSSSSSPSASRIESSTQFNESYDSHSASSIEISTPSSTTTPSTLTSPTSSTSTSHSSLDHHQSHSILSSSASDEILQLLSIENEEMRQVIVKLMVELESMKTSAEKLILESTEGHARELQLLRQDEAKRVMEILRAYETKLAAELAHAQSIAAEEKNALKNQFTDIVNTTLAALRESHESTLAANARSLEEYASKWSAELLRGPITKVATDLKNDATDRLSLTLSIKESLADTHAATLQYYNIAKESAAYARVARQWILLNDRVSKFPGAPFYPQLIAYINACKEVPQLSSIIDSIQSNPSNGPSSSTSLVRLSQIGSPTLNQLKTEFAEASKAARTSVLAPEGANAFQHGFASLREAFRSSAPAAVTTIASTVEKGVSVGVSAVLSSDNPSTSSSTSSASSASEDIAEKNWHALQQAESFLHADALGPAIDTLQALDGAPAALMKPWIERAQQTYYVSSSLDFFGYQTANLDFTAPSPPPSSPIAPSTSSL